MSQKSANPQYTAVMIDPNLFSVGFAVGAVLGKLLLKNTVLAVAFGMGLGMAVGTSSRQIERP